MTNNRSGAPSFGDNLAQQLYADGKLTRKAPGRHFILHRDTVCAFLFEARALLVAAPKAASYIGVAVTALAAILSAQFQDFLGLPGNTWQAIFVLITVCGCLGAIGQLWQILSNWRRRTIQALTDELGARGAIVEPPENSNQSN